MYIELFIKKMYHKGGVLMAITIELKVVPSSGRSGWVYDKSGMLKCYLKSPPEKGQANEELIKVLAKALGITMNLVTIISGYQFRKKVVKIDVDMSYDELCRKLGIEVNKNSDQQMSLFNVKK